MYCDADVLAFISILLKLDKSTRIDERGRRSDNIEMLTWHVNMYLLSRSEVQIIRICSNLEMTARKAISESHVDICRELMNSSANCCDAATGVGKMAQMQTCGR